MATLNELLELATHRALTEYERSELRRLISDRDPRESSDIIKILLARVENPQPIDENRARMIIENIMEAAPTPKIRSLKASWLRYAAAILLLLVGSVIYYQFFKTPLKNQVTAITPAPKDINPGFNRAVLTLSDGRKIELDSAASETIKDGSLSIENNQGQLSYKNANAAVINTMSTPKGGQYQLTLSDGTRIWLNAASSITYPTVFNGANRQVFITGEVYFEVPGNKEKPFVVKTASDEIIVLGTSFNVNAYDDESAVKTTLIEGAVKVNNKILKPGQAYMSDRIITTNTSQDIAWKNGAFDFNNLTLEQAARQIGRWYDVEIKFDGVLPKAEIYGGVSRTVTLQRLLKGMDGEFAHFNLQGKVLHIKAL